MRKLWLLLIVLLAAFSLLIVACGDDDENNDITNPDDADWAISFIQIPDEIHRENGYWFNAFWFGAADAITTSDVFTLSIDGVDTPVQLYSYDSEWSVSGYNIMLSPGSSYPIVFAKNGTTIISKTVTMPYAATCSFPVDYDPTQSASISWSLAGNNQTQAVTVSASNWDGSYDDYDEEVYSISNTARSYTIPANAVQDLGVGTEFELSVIQTNSYFSGRVYLFTMQGEYALYGDYVKQAQKNPSMLRKLMGR